MPKPLAKRDLYTYIDFSYFPSWCNATYRADV